MKGEWMDKCNRRREGGNGVDKVSEIGWGGGREYKCHVSSANPA